MTAVEFEVKLDAPIRMNRFIDGTSTITTAYLAPGVHKIRLFPGGDKVLFSIAPADAPIGYSVPLPATSLRDLL